jgi:hypothetical protein
VGSTIGPVGNKFEEYSLALKVSEGLSSPSAEILTAATGSSVAPGFQMISIKPSLASESANGVNGQQNGMFNDTSNDDPAGNADKDDDVDLANSASQARAEAESALNALFGTENGSFTPKPSRSEIARGQFMKYPESLRLDESDSASPPAPPNYDAAVAAATENKDIQTVFFVNFPPSLQGTQQDSLKKLMESIKSWQSWSSTICEGKVQEQVDKKALPSDNSAESMMARSTYRSKVFDYIMRKSSWYVLFHKCHHYVSLLTMSLGSPRRSIRTSPSTSRSENSNSTRQSSPPSSKASRSPQPCSRNWRRSCPP